MTMSTSWPLCSICGRHKTSQCSFEGYQLDRLRLLVWTINWLTTFTPDIFQGMAIKWHQIWLKGLKRVKDEYTAWRRKNIYTDAYSRNKLVKAVVLWMLTYESLGFIMDVPKWESTVNEERPPSESAPILLRTKSPPEFKSLIEKADSLWPMTCVRSECLHNSPV